MRIINSLQYEDINSVFWKRNPFENRVEEKGAPDLRVSAAFLGGMGLSMDEG